MREAPSSASSDVPAPITGRERSPKGRMWMQIRDVFAFDFRRNVKKMALMAIFNVAFFAMNIIQDVMTKAQSPTAENFLAVRTAGALTCASYVAIVFGASIIAEDFEKKTGHLLFPQVSHGRLLTGKYLSRLAGGSASLSAYYVSVVIMSAASYGTVPWTLWGTLAWSIAYLHAWLSVVTLASVVFNRTATALAGSFIFSVILSNITFAFGVSNPEWEPLVLLPFIGLIVTWWSDMPDPRYVIFYTDWTGISHGSWITPSVEGAIFIIASLSMTLLVSSYLIYRQKQVKT